MNPSSEETPSNESEGEKLYDMVLFLGTTKENLQKVKSNACDIHVVDA